MATLPDHFRALLSSIEPNDTRLAVAQDIPNQVRKYLKDSIKIDTIEPHTRLAGSYARQTAIRDIKDVDIILIVDDDYYDGEAEVVLEAALSALYKLPDYLDEPGEASVRRRQRRSVNVTLQKSDISL